MWLKEQIRSYVNAKKLYGNQGDEVRVINEYGNVVIVELNGERFAVNIEKLSELPTHAIGDGLGFKGQHFN